METITSIYYWLHQHVSVEGWSSLASWVTAGIALTAAVVGLYQLMEARRTRERQIQPYVVVYTELDPDDWQNLDLVVENVGQTPAFRIRLELPPLTIKPFVNEVTGEKESFLPLPDEIGMLAPRQKWRTHWDDATRRENDRKQYGDRLGSRFEGQVSFQDSTSRAYQLPVILDWNTFRNTRRAKTRTESTTTRIL